jgi:DNA invertase Pin-like site-specific DNA recombinase
MRIGYRRVSTIDQNLARQDLGEVDKVFEEKLSGASAKDRPQLQGMIEFAREGDEVIIYSIDRMARDLRDCLNIVTTLNNKGVTVTFLSERLSFSGNEDDPFSRLQLHLMSAFAAYELAILKHRQKAGILKAKERGTYKGRPATTDVAAIMAMHRQGKGATHIARSLNISRATVYRTLNASGVSSGGSKPMNDTVAATQ